MDTEHNIPPGKTQLKQIEQYRDRWSFLEGNSGLERLSEKPSATQLRALEIFQEYDDSFLERISPDISLAIWEKGSILFREGDYIDVAFHVINGEVDISLDKAAAAKAKPVFDTARTSLVDLEGLPGQAARSTGKPPARRTDQHRVGRDRAPQRSSSHIEFLATVDFALAPGGIRLGHGEFFGEIGALSGWPQSVTAKVASKCALVQIRVPALRLMRKKSTALKNRLDSLYRERALHTQLKTTPLFSGCPDEYIEALEDIVELVSCDPGETIVHEGNPVDAFYIVRSGFVKLQQSIDEGHIVVSYLSKGMSLGDTETMVDEITGWLWTATSVEYAELVKVPADALQRILARFPAIRERLWGSAIARVKEAGFTKTTLSHAAFTQEALDRGLVQGNSVLVIDLDVCTRCDDCVRACAATHGGRPRFIREGDKSGNLLIVKSCYHCRDPVCLVGCPTGAIRRAGVQDVVEIREDLCIGCGACANNCPYDNIVMHDTQETWPQDMSPTYLRGTNRFVASKCDLCFDTGHEPACVSNCPQGCAHRVGSLEAFQQLLNCGSKGG